MLKDIESKIPKYFSIEYTRTSYVRISIKIIFKSSIAVKYIIESFTDGYTTNTRLSKISTICKERVDIDDDKIYFRRYYKMNNDISIEENISLAVSGGLEQVDSEKIKEYLKPSKA